jgi:sigma54-dependent transcription regulator
MLVRKDKERFEVFADKLWSAIDMSLKARYSNYQGLDAPPTRMAPVEKQARTDGAKTMEEVSTEYATKMNIRR